MYQKDKCLVFGISKKEEKLAEEAKGRWTGRPVGPCPLLRLKLWEEQHQSSMSVWDSGGEGALHPASHIEFWKVMPSQKQLSPLMAQQQLQELVWSSPSWDAEVSKEGQNVKRVFREVSSRCQPGPSTCKLRDRTLNSHMKIGNNQEPHSPNILLSR